MTSEYDSKEGGCRGGENSEQSPESLLATEWLFYHKGKTNNACSLEAIMPVMAELLRLGHNFDAIKAKITDPKRRKTETAWEFERHWKGVEAVPVADPSEPLVYAPDRPYPTYAPVNRPETPEEKQARLKAKAAYLQGGAA